MKSARKWPWKRVAYPSYLDRSGIELLAELLCSCRCRTAGSSARRLGYAREIAALESRHRRLARPWQKHLEATRSSLAQAAEAAAQESGIALILGAGVLADLPLTVFRRCFAETWLVDICFSPKTFACAQRSRGRLRCVLADVTGCVERVAAEPRRAVQQRPPSSLPFALPDRLSFIASVNCLTQLPLLPAAWLLKQALEEEAVEQLSQSLMLAHLQQLSSAAVPACLISETMDERFSHDGRCIDQTNYGPLIEPKLKDVGASCRSTWPWQVHPAGELPRGETEVRRVSAWTW